MPENHISLFCYFLKSRFFYFELSNVRADKTNKELSKYQVLYLFGKLMMCTFMGSLKKSKVTFGKIYKGVLGAAFLSAGTVT